MGGVNFTFVLNIAARSVGFNFTFTFARTETSQNGIPLKT